VLIFRSFLVRVTILFLEETRRMWLFYTYGDRLVGNSRTVHNGKQRSSEKERRVRNNAWLQVSGIPAQNALSSLTYFAG